ncbi:MAG: polyprenyl synthetase family protein [Spirochaetia bacterium]
MPIFNHPSLTKHLNNIEQCLESYFQFPYTQLFFTQQTGQELDYDLLHLQYALDPIKHLIQLGGKRWRAIALVLTGEALNLPATPLLVKFASLLELTHTGSLIIDDIEDQSPLRRGKESAHICYGMDISINAGNYAYFLATNIIDSADLSIEKKYATFSAWAKAMRCLHIGQGLDITWHRENTFWPSISQYSTMCEMKTGGLSYLIGEWPGILTEMDQNKINSLGQAWRSIGLVFQILDDIKNLHGGIKGKMPADDLIEGKKSLPLILGIQKDPNFKDIIEPFFKQVKELTASEQQDMMQAILGKIFEMGVLQESTQIAKTILQEAREAIFLLLGISNCSLIEIFLDSLLEEMS